ncbi:Caleosin related protein-domain-containing protein [Stachybotrys elegans]|uniref:Caleosin related protein-domain-containing protein n=1 Tax=Stachybotrys elegans TaxID=80388 RepID=A0A8K0SQU8_9HYPO|nr:Caleosin related protein-domain-containing protein [Stachybotrys elegans]
MNPTLRQRSRPADHADKKDIKESSPTVLQRHVEFWDRDNDGIIHPWDVYNGFRELGFGILFSIGSLLIPVFFSYPTRLGHSWLPDPLLRIYVKDIHKAKHGSDTGIYDFDGNFDEQRFNELYERFDTTGAGGLSAGDMLALWKKDRCAADPAGWSFAFMEWWTTWLLLQKDGLVWKDDLRACYDGTLFWRIKDQRDEDKKAHAEKGGQASWNPFRLPPKTAME